MTSTTSATRSRTFVTDFLTRTRMHVRWSGRAGLTTVLATAVTLPSPASAQQAKKVGHPVNTVLFVCEHGTVKSLVAKLEFERAARARGLFMRAASRGSAPDSALPPWMRDNLERDGALLGDWRPLRLTQADLDSAIVIVSFDLPTGVFGTSSGRRERWDGLPALSQNYLAGRNAIRTRVRRLVDSLATNRR